MQRLATDETQIMNFINDNEARLSYLLSELRYPYTGIPYSLLILITELSVWFSGKFEESIKKSQLSRKRVTSFTLRSRSIIQGQIGFSIFQFNSYPLKILGKELSK